MSPLDSKQAKPLSPSDIVIFGGTGDLSVRKILPALYYRLRDGQLPASSRIVVLGRKPASRDEYQATLRKAMQEFVSQSDFTETDFARLATCVEYQVVDAREAAHYGPLRELLEKDARPVRVFYLATPADIFAGICGNLKAGGLVTDETRVVLEKPIGKDLQSFCHINNAVLQHLSEKQVYRIDHYLGKETVQNLMVLRFANNVFERVWNADVIDHVQITVAESIGVGDRGGYYDQSGAMRDMIQNHLLQLLCLVAMESPAQITPDAVRDEKLKVLRALRPILPEFLSHYTVRGQYVASGGMQGYLEDIKKPESDTETFVAIKAHVDTWRWSGVPFYLRSGKRMPERYSEIVIQFKRTPHNIFPTLGDEIESNKLIIRIQPDERVQFQMNTKIPGPGGYRMKPVNLNLSFADEFHERYPDAYERLLMDVVRGNPTLFMRSDEVEAAWVWTEYLLKGWQEREVKPRPYPAGTSGPREAEMLLARDGRAWHENG
jgi:glucose-6-phosphate 1-dehydrogenase